MSAEQAWPAAPVEARAPTLSRLPPRPDAHARRRFRDVLGQFATGITVLTVGGDSPHGMTANAFSSVSLDPALVLVCVDRHAVMHEAIRRRGTFAVSVLAADQEHLARHFADRRRPHGQAEFAGVDWRIGPCGGAPLLVGALAWLECELMDVHPAGDHSIFLGRVLDTGREPARDALVFFGGRYGRASSSMCDDLGDSEEGR